MDRPYRTSENTVMSKKTKAFANRNRIEAEFVEQISGEEQINKIEEHAIRQMDRGFIIGEISYHFKKYYFDCLHNENGLVQVKTISWALDQMNRVLRPKEIKVTSIHQDSKNNALFKINYVLI